MSQTLTLARPYARAAFGLARDHGRLAAWSSLLGFAASVAADVRGRAVLAHPALTQAQLFELLLPQGASDPNFQQFLSVLVANRRLPLLPEIHGLFEQLRADEEKVLKVKITSAAEMSEADLASMVEALKRRFGRAIQATHTVDAELLGGAIIDAGDTVIDGSVRSKLRRLETLLAQ